MDLMYPMRTESKGGKRYVIVVFDDFPRYSFVSFLIEKSETIEHLKSLFTRIRVGIGHAIVKIKVIGGKSSKMWMLTFFVF